MAEDEYTDDELDDLSADQLLEIETLAFTATQQPTVSPHSTPPSDHGDQVIKIEEQPASAVYNGLQQTQTQTAPHPDHSGQVTSLDEQSASAVHNGPQQTQTQTTQPPRALPLRGSLDTMSVEDLQARVERIESDFRELSTAYEKSNGAVGVLRSKHTSLTKQFEHRILMLNKERNELVAKQKAELAACKHKEEQSRTNNLFMEQDIVREAGRPKQSRRVQKDNAGKTVRGTAATTPKKNRTAQFGDGFASDDVVMVSPSKARHRSKPSTPKHGAKRKRTAGEASPSRTLPLSEPAEPVQINDPMSIDLPEDTYGAFLENVAKDDDKFKFLQRLMRHRPFGQRETTFEALTKYALPSEPTRLLSSTVYDNLARYRGDAEGFAMHYCHVLVSLWQDCLRERYFAPVRFFLDSLQFVLAFLPLEKTASLAEEVVPVVQSTADPVLPPEGEAVKDSLMLKNLDVQNLDVQDLDILNLDAGPQSELRKNIDLLESISLLLTIARSCVGSYEAKALFWQKMNEHVCLITLWTTQPLPVIQATLQLLSTSPTDTTFGAIIAHADPEKAAKKQSEQENELINRLITLLRHPPTAPSSNSSTSTSSAPYSATTIADLRLSTLQALTSLLPHKHGVVLLAKHPAFLGNLLHMLNSTIATLYSTAPHTPLHSALTRVINIACRLAHAVLCTYPEAADRRSLLAAVPGAGHAHLVGLTRLAFAEEKGALERGWEDEVVNMAHALLDEYLSPDEGDALMRVFGSGKSA
ncbi:uncharacterized protein K452DRAFT_293130 [Aplosporella prunicola CBS 121167]|uniref:DNA repair protein Rad26 n=1 Tax=Aplosporella prunicola CBS 121167 TaxID=1176127 RepID=A0A6A6AUD2_9PEZI|nr:uncharacterized protein K452DRAFT_293130 [Aplosporella prunicola CBS 121167]KAF2135569.1 hypothetical protein K452DRAFT_293130 [Aplosporella prunicola CBS 121167]